MRTILYCVCWWGGDRGWGCYVLHCDVLRCTPRLCEARRKARAVSVCLSGWLVVCHGWSISVRVNTIMISLTWVFLSHLWLLMV